MLCLALFEELRGAVGKGMQIIRFSCVLRLTRVARLARLMRQLPELTILIKGLDAFNRLTSLLNSLQNTLTEHYIRVNKHCLNMRDLHERLV